MKSLTRYHAPETRRLLMIVLMISISVGSLLADGGAGGMYFGYQTSTYPFLEDNYPIASNTLGLAYYGGFGYGVSSDNAITGGFGMAIMDTENDTGIAGGFGGIISGGRILSWPISLSIVNYLGLGGLVTGAYAVDGVEGFMAVYEEITLELGIPIIPWFMPTFYVGYQAMANLVPGRLFKTFVSYTPVFGFRIQWGDFD